MDNEGNKLGKNIFDKSPFGATGRNWPILTFISAELIFETCSKKLGCHWIVIALSSLTLISGKLLSEFCLM